MNWLFCGLGNKGRRYSRTRHNIGFMVVDAFAKDLRLKFPPRIFTIRKTYTSASGIYGEQDITIMKPLTYMNLSGIAVRNILQEIDIPLERVIIILDDFNLEMGRLRLRKRGSGGGHKGLNSIIRAVNSENIPRLRIGIGPLPPNVDPVYYVLSPFTDKEMDVITNTINKVVECLKIVVDEGIDKAMTRCNQ
ncbi:MAG: aminoacyl-tRNA hydrolase [Candidatus Coatesbacteria bacterium]|nr:MAG: aminoacyl-tRNA hydrolase [Candidatus Coatesbacteria bacterium]